ncbi:MAG: M28 family peptidase [Gemmatimonadota bacterium]|nr:MAG: M28 family peptidase [Gemmatimonadota bacterium]
MKAGVLGLLICFFVVLSVVGTVRSEQESFLALIDVDSPEHEQYLTDFEITVLAVYEGRAFVKISEDQKDELYRVGLELNVLRNDQGTEDDYLLYVPEGNRMKIAEHAEVLDYRNGTALLRASPSEAERASRFGYGLTRISKDRLPRDRKKPQPPVPSTDPEMYAFLESILSNVSESEIRATIKRLQDFRTRYSCTDSCQAAAAYLSDRFTSFGLSVSYDFYTYGGELCSGQTWRNVVAVHPGVADTSQKYILCGHYDSKNVYGNSWISAPGADDNASGTAAVVEAARVLSMYDFDATILFICFSGEEQGLLGSEHYANWASDRDMDIRGVINLDMIAYVDDPPNDTWDINIYGDSDSYDLALFFADRVNQHTTAEPLVINTGFEQWGSDHYSFALLGYKAIFAIDAQLWGSPDWTPYYHSDGDTLGTLNLPYATEVVRASIAAVAALAGPIGVGDYQSPTMETIGEPQNQYYSRAPLFSNFGFDDDMALDDGWYQINSYTGEWSVLFTNVSGRNWDSDGWTLSEFSSLPNGSYIVYFKAVDDAGNVEGESGEWNWQFYKDTSPPSAPLLSSPTHPDEEDWYSAVDVLFQWEEPYDLSGVIGYSYVFDQSPETMPDETRDNTMREKGYYSLADGTYYFHCRAGDDVCLWGPAAHYRIMIDTEPPESPLDLTVDPPEWTNDSTFVLTWTNPDDLSGVEGAYYRLSSPPAFVDDGTFTTLYPLNLSAAAEGTHTVYVWLQDRADNVDHNKSASVTLAFDATAPSQGTISISGGADTTTSLVVTLSFLSAVDEMSGMGSGALMQFSNNGQTWSPAEPLDSTKHDWDLSQYGGSGGSGHKRVSVRYRDVAGNWSGPFSDSIVCDLPLAISTDTLPPGKMGFEYEHTLSAAGGWPPYTWLVYSGMLPCGLTLDATGCLSGVPDSVECRTFEVAVVDSVMNTERVGLSMQIEAPRKGDIDGDGHVDIVDVVMNISIILQDMIPSYGQLMAADCDATGAIDILDTMCIVHIIIGGG